ncbi:MAG: ring-cleaving dioxygenase [Fimbriimonadaceae bacterium]|nr:ring-cleaving dioxygenase [Fimbriimonadaceae bacterium]QYK56731.1 MAG: ring-cleaving dioxygenase [Fimbriimonadaceae bacterium]
MAVHGIHHVTAMCGDSQRNVDFYAGVLGLRMVKVTVNFDDPGTYHLYYGDATGSPGSAMTFFPWPDAYRGRHGTGQVGRTAFSVPVGALAYWRGRLAENGVEFTEATRFGEARLNFVDPDGLNLALVEAVDDRNAWDQSDVPLEAAIRGFHSTELWLEACEQTERLMDEQLGFRFLAEEGNVRRLASADGPGGFIELVCLPNQGRGRDGVGTVHHIAYRVPDDAAQVELLGSLRSSGQNVTPVQERKYFRSIYFREPGGVLFEVATDTPGFAVDEPVEHLGETLVLPEWLEEYRPQIVRRLPKITTPAGVTVP